MTKSEAEFDLGTELSGGKFSVQPELFKKHFISIGSSGSGKTVLAKAIIEEAAINNIPSIIIDTQGDLAGLFENEDIDSLTEHSIPSVRQEELRKNSLVDIYTPTSSKGIPISVNPLIAPPQKTEYEDAVGIFQNISTSLAGLLDYGDDDKGRNAQTIIYKLLYENWKSGKSIKTIANLKRELAVNKDEKEIKTMLNKLEYLSVGENDLLFSLGEKIDIQKLMNKPNGKSKISVFYLNSINTESQKEFFLSILLNQLYQWMLSHPKKDLQALLYIDEVARFLPSGNLKPISKPILTLLLKQARKYGLGVMLSSQNPGDIDYTAFAQIGSWAIGRLTTKQDLEKIKRALSSTSQDTDQIIKKIPSMKPSQFVFFSPDRNIPVTEFACRWLLTKHRTLTLEDVAKLYPKKIQTEDLDLKSGQTDKHDLKKNDDAKDEDSRDEVPLGHIPHLPLRYTLEQIQKNIGRNRSKKFAIFGDYNDTAHTSIIYMPLLKCIIEHKTKKFLKTQNIVSTIYVDMMNLDLLKITDKIQPAVNIKNVLDLSPTELNLIKIMGSQAFTIEKAVDKTSKTKNSLSKTINGLIKKNLAKYSEIGKNKLYRFTLDITPFKDLMRLSSEELEADMTKLDAKTQREKYKQDAIIQILNKIWPEISNLESEIVYNPVYETIITSKRNKKIVRIGGYDGAEN
ncbi:ATP-binding protein [Candidatus Woesearchaeota archaeon]|nr:ATP-binding protein [Candidatus Woesearchaeota archaeon]